MTGTDTVNTLSAAMSNMDARIQVKLITFLGFLIESKGNIRKVALMLTLLLYILAATTKDKTFGLQYYTVVILLKSITST